MDAGAIARPQVGGGQPLQRLPLSRCSGNDAADATRESPASECPKRGGRTAGSGAKYVFSLASAP